MRSLLLILIVFMLNTPGNSQDIIISNAHNIIDDNYTYIIYSANSSEIDSCIEKFKKNWAYIESETPGKIIWKYVPIPGLEHSAKIILVDGIFNKEGAIEYYTPFIDDIGKKKLIKNMKAGEQRYITLIFLDGKTNAVIGPYKHKAVKDYLNKLINAQK